jgi:hypothetical protein
LWPLAKKTLDTPELDTWPYAHSTDGMITLTNIYFNMRFCPEPVKNSAKIFTIATASRYEFFCGGIEPASPAREQPQK